MQTWWVVSQVLPAGHAPQSCELSQPSPTTPQYWPPVNAQETLVQLGLPQMPATLAPQTNPAGQLDPQFAEPPQPSPIVPQYVTPEAVQLWAGTQPGAMHRCFRGSQTALPAQPPQSRACPQPSPIEPQYCPPANEQVAGAQLELPQRLATPVPPQVSGAVQLAPQSMDRPQPSPIVPQ